MSDATNVVKYEKPDGLVPQGFVEEANQIIIIDQESYDAAAERGRFFKSVGKRWEEERVKRRKLVEPIMQQIQDDFLPIIQECANAEKVIKGLLTEFERAEKAERDRLQAIADKAAREEREAAEKRAKALEKKGDVEAAQAVREVAAVTTAVTVAPTFTKAAGTSSRKVWKGRVEDSRQFINWLNEHPEFIDQCVEFKVSGLNKIADLYKSTKPVAGLAQTQEDQQALR